MQNNNDIHFFGKDRYFQTYSKEIMDIVKAVYSHGKVVMGPEVEEFEKKVAGYCSRKYAVAVGSCTDALYFSLLGAGIKAGDEVLVAGFSFIASASCIIRAGAIPVFIDINPQTYMMDLNDLKTKITDKTKAIIAVGLFGDCLDIDAVETIGKQYNLTIIEDAAQSIGSRYKNRKAGSIGLCSCLSFDPTKLLSAQSNGGAVLTDNALLYEHISRLRYHGKNPATGKFEILGFNSRLSSLQAALLSFGLDKIEEWIERHREIAQMYIEGLSDIYQLILPKEREDSKHVYHKFVMQAQNRDELKEWLKTNHIETMVHYEQAIPETDAFRVYQHKAQKLIEIDQLKSNLLSLPIHNWLKDGEIKYIIQKIQDFYGR